MVDLIIWMFCMIVIFFLMFLIGFVSKKLIGKIQSKPIRKTVFAIFSILFLPAMLSVWSVENMDEFDFRFAPFSLNLHSRSRLIVWTSVLYVAAYYYLFMFLFQNI